jgi:hypothetical protein
VCAQSVGSTLRAGRMRRRGCVCGSSLWSRAGGGGWHLYHHRERELRGEELIVGASFGCGSFEERPQKLQAELLRAFELPDME